MSASNAYLQVVEAFGSMGLRRCAYCGEYRPIEIFYIKQDGRADSYCNPCKRIKRKEARDKDPEKTKAQKRASRQRHPETSKLWWDNNPDKVERYARNFKIKNRDEQRHAFYAHGILPEQTEQIYEFQDHCCFICGKEITIGPGGSRRIDHSHTTGFVRGLLCSRCNPMLGWFEMHADRIEEYVTNPPTQKLGMEIITERRRQNPSGR